GLLLYLYFDQRINLNNFFIKNDVSHVEQLNNIQSIELKKFTITKQQEYFYSYHSTHQKNYFIHKGRVEKLIKAFESLKIIRKFNDEEEKILIGKKLFNENSPSIYLTYAKDKYHLIVGDKLEYEKGF